MRATAETVAPAAVRQPWLPLAALLLCALLWSLNGPLIKLLQEPRDGLPGVSGVAIACYRSLIGGLALLPLGWRHRRSLLSAGRGWAAASVTLFTIMTTSFVIATANTAAANAIVLQYSSPVWVFLLSPLLLKEHPRLGDGAILLVAMIGVAVIFFGSPVTETGWLTVALVSGFGYGSLTVVLRGLRAAHPVAVATLNTLGSGLVLAPALWLWGTFSLGPTQWALMLTMGLVQFTVPYVVFSWALQRVAAYRAALIVLLEAVLNPLLTWLLVGEVVPAATLAGGPLILVSVALWLWRSRRPVVDV